MSEHFELPNVPSIVTVASCFILSATYVLSLYVWGANQNRDHPSTIKKRFCSVSVVMLISPLFVYFTSSKELLDHIRLNELIGLRIPGIFPAVIIPLVLTIVLFLGPLSVQLYNGVSQSYLDPKFWAANLTNPMWLRNHVVAPLSEEFTFRACMLPVLLQSFTTTTAVFVQPLFFGVAHFHHLTEKLRSGMDKKIAIITSCFQFIYTTIFGIYSAYLFTRTGHFIAPFIAHAFCNHMGFPDFQELFNQAPETRKIFIGLYILGLASWIILLPILTKPSWFSNDQFWNNL